jgi:peroxiredoxin
MPAYDADLAKFEGYDAQVLGISIDSWHTNAAWAKSLGGLHYPLLSDFWPHGAVAEKYGVLRAEGQAERAIFIVDKTGKIVYIDVHDIDLQPDNEDLFEVLRQL